MDNDDNSDDIQYGVPNVTNVPVYPRIQFGGTSITVHSADGQRWITVKHLAEALGYEDHRALVNLIHRKPLEFTGKTFVIKLMTNSRGNPHSMVINYHGCIRAAMLSDAPKAVAFRDWAEDVLFKAMTQQPTGDLVPPGFLPNLERALAHLIERQIANESRMDRLEQTQQRTLVPADRDISHDPTPAQRLRTLIAPQLPPKGFNSGGSFDKYAAELCNVRLGSYPRMRQRRHLQKQPEYVVQPCPEIDNVIRAAYKNWLSIKDNYRLF